MKRLLITYLCLVAATATYAQPRPSIPVYWWDEVSQWILSRDKTASDSLRDLIGAKVDTLTTNALSDSLGAYLDTLTIIPDSAQVNLWVVWDTLGAYLDTLTVFPDSVTHSIYSDTAEYARRADTSLHCADLSSISFFSRSVIETLYTYYGDTATADTSDTVCFSGYTWIWVNVPGGALKTNIGAWGTLIFDNVDSYWTNINDCGGAGVGLIYALDSVTCVPDSALHASTQENDTIFFYLPQERGMDCTKTDSVAVYSNGTAWLPVCISGGGLWGIFTSYCYTRYDTAYAIIAGDTLMVSAWEMNY